jgi:hypothetical protein
MACFKGRPQRLARDKDSELLIQQLGHKLERSLLLAESPDISLPGCHHAHNPICLGQLSALPLELLIQVLSYVVVVPCNIHVYTPYNNRKNGWRLSLCPESSFDPCWGRCSCRSGGLGGTVTDYMDTALLLVSRAMRHTTLDIIFARNHFVFTDIYDLRDFASKLPPVAARIQSLRLWRTVGDSFCWHFLAEDMACTRRLLKSLRHLELRVLLNYPSTYESIYEDGFLIELCHFRKPLPESFECSVQWQGEPHYWRRLGLDEGTPKRVQEKLIKIFTGAYGDEIPFSTPPPEKVREADTPLNNKKGIIAWT